MYIGGGLGGPPTKVTPQRGEDPWGGLWTSSSLLGTLEEYGEGRVISKRDPPREGVYIILGISLFLSYLSLLEELLLTILSGGGSVSVVVVE